jgi:HKD family nuclease
MEVEPLHQIDIGDIEYRSFGEVLSELLHDTDYSEFQFAVAYMKKSGLLRLGSPITSFLENDGNIAGVVGIDGITTRSSLEALVEFAPNSKIFKNPSDRMEFHPKIYFFKGEDKATIVVGSANLTKQGLYQNIEFGYILKLDLNQNSDVSVFHDLEEIMEELLDDSNPNIQPIDENIISKLDEDEELGSESYSGGSSPSTQSESDEGPSAVENLFSDGSGGAIPSAPPRTSINPGATEPAKATTFILQLSASDSSHRTGTEGTPMVLIPHDALPFFPELAKSGRTNIRMISLM